MSRSDLMSLAIAAFMIGTIFGLAAWSVIYSSGGQFNRGEENGEGSGIRQAQEENRAHRRRD